MPHIDPAARAPGPRNAGPREPLIWIVPACGGSMYPFIVDGDVIHVQQAKASDLRKGAVAVYRTESAHMAAHRFFGMARKHGISVLRVRGDASEGPFTYVDPEHVLGQVVAVQRGSSLRRIDTWYWRGLGLAWTIPRAVGSVLLHPRDWAQRLGAGALFLMQCSRWYRRLGWRLVGKRVVYRPGTPEDLRQLLLEKSYMRDHVPVPSDFEYAQERDVVGRGRGCFVACLGNKVVGCVGVSRAPEGQETEAYWMISGLWVHWRYRGAGIGRGLLIMAGATLLRQGVDKMLASVWDGNAGALALADRVGARRPAWSELLPEMSTSHAVHDSIMVASTLSEDLKALYERGILEKYRGTGCCDALMPHDLGTM